MPHSVSACTRPASPTSASAWSFAHPSCARSRSYAAMTSAGTSPSNKPRMLPRTVACRYHRPAPQTGRHAQQAGPKSTAGHRPRWHNGSPSCCRWGWRSRFLPLASTSPNSCPVKPRTARLSSAGPYPFSLTTPQPRPVKPCPVASACRRFAERRVSPCGTSHESMQTDRSASGQHGDGSPTIR